MLYYTYYGVPYEASIRQSDALALAGPVFSYPAAMLGHRHRAAHTVELQYIVYRTVLKWEI